MPPPPSPPPGSGPIPPPPPAPRPKVVVFLQAVFGLTLEEFDDDARAAAVAGVGALLAHLGVVDAGVELVGVAAASVVATFRVASATPVDDLARLLESVTTDDVERFVNTSAESPLVLAAFGCTDESALNYNTAAFNDDGSCVHCTVAVDACGVCGGLGGSCNGCDGKPGSGASISRCGLCRTPSDGDGEDDDDDDDGGACGGEVDLASSDLAAASLAGDASIPAGLLAAYVAWHVILCAVLGCAIVRRHRLLAKPAATVAPGVGPESRPVNLPEVRVLHRRPPPPAEAPTFSEVGALNRGRDRAPAGVGLEQPSGAEPAPDPAVSRPARGLPQAGRGGALPVVMQAAVSRRVAGP